MVMTRINKVAGIANSLPDLEVLGPATGDLLVLSWGGTYGTVRTAVETAQSKGLSVAHAHLKYMNPFPKNLEAIVKSYRRVLIPELNSGHLRMLIRAKYLVDAIGKNKCQGKPFLVRELVEAIESALAGR
jgi:2-oxoglutarate ferredoxin oxidoreductase subunit alpha